MTTTARLNVKTWLTSTGRSDVVALINEIEMEWRSLGLKTRRNWWKILAGHADGTQHIVAGRPFPVLAEARRRQRLPVEGYVFSGDPSSATPQVWHGRWSRSEEP